MAQLVSDRIWQKIGAEEDAYLIVDPTGMAACGGGMNVALAACDTPFLAALNPWLDHLASGLPTAAAATRFAARNGGWRVGDGKFAPYDGKLDTRSYGEWSGGLKLPLWRDRAIDPRRAELRAVTDAFAAGNCELLEFVSGDPGRVAGLLDADGIVVVEREKLASLIPAAHKKVEDEAKRIAQIKEGKTAASWLVSSLRAAGVLKEGEEL